jgi:adenylate cyclase
MAIEIERKFLVHGDAWRAAAVRRTRIRQAYLVSDTGASLRVRISQPEGSDAPAAAHLNLKVGGLEVRRFEFEYAVPLADAEAMFLNFAGRVIEKTRHEVPGDGVTWEVDEFHAEDAGLTVAEVELEDEAQVFDRPGWLGQEVSDDPRYYNVMLVAHPYSEWGV